MFYSDPNLESACFIFQGWPRKPSNTSKRTNVSGLSWTDRIVPPLQERTAISSMTTTRNESSRPHGFKQQDCYLMDKLMENWRRQPSGEDCRHETRGRLAGGELAPATDT